MNLLPENQVTNGIKTVMNITAPYLGPFGKGVSTVDALDDFQQFKNDPSLYNFWNLGANFLQYNPAKTGSWDEKISNIQEAVDGIRNANEINQNKKKYGGKIHNIFDLKI